MEDKFSQQLKTDVLVLLIVGIVGFLRLRKCAPEKYGLLRETALPENLFLSTKFPANGK